jgi:AcrR family transcriptional regulator
MRADARDNRERILRAARPILADQGGQASLNKIAQQAGVGPGTLYRHFPTLQALLVAIIGDDVEALCDQGRALLDHADPDEALRLWLRAFAVHATAMRGLVGSQLAALPAVGTDPALAGCHDAITATGAALLARTALPDIEIADLLKLVSGIAWTSEQSPEDTGLLDRLLALVRVGRAASPAQ